MHRMKGQAVTDIVWTALVLVVIVILLVFFFVSNMVSSFVSEPSGFTVSMIKILNDPYSVLEGISQLKVDDRLAFEHLLEASLVGSLQKSQSGKLPAGISEFVKKYDRELYMISSGNIFSITNIRGTSLEEISCGDNAYCNDDFPSVGGTYFTLGGICPVGATGIPDGGKCKSVQYCCQYNEKEYLKANTDKPNSRTKFSITRCGRNKIGVCNPNLILMTTDQGNSEFPYCSNGYIQIEDPQGACKETNNGKTPTCCASASGTALQKANVAQKADIPFLYKGKTLFEPKEYRCQDPLTQCSGEYVGGLCPQESKCCITDNIHCQPLGGDYSYTKYYCKDESDCSGTTKNDLCPDPDAPTASSYKCCIEDKPEPPDKSEATADTKDYGPCTLIGHTYSDAARTSHIEVTVGD